MDARAEQLVLDYLRRLGEASQHVLGPDERAAFMTRSRAAIAGQIGEARAAADVQRALERLGDPNELAARERQRLDAASAGQPPAGLPGSFAPPSAVQPPAGLSGLLSPAPVEPPAAAGTPGPGDGGARAGPPGTPPGPAPGTAQARLRDVLTLARRHPVETAAVLLLGVGGLIYPFPLWLTGAVAVIAARGWDARDKWAALAVPGAFALVAAVAIAGLTARSGTMAGYVSTVRIDGWDLIRAGSLAAAAYLAWRLRRGRRPRREPPWRRPPRP